MYSPEELQRIEHARRKARQTKFNNSEHGKAANKLWYETVGRGRRMERRYGISEDEYDEILKAQGGCCAICKTDKPGRTGGGRESWAIDHNHATGKVRGLLCHGCNLKLGWIENKEWMDAALMYLQPKRE